MDYSGHIRRSYGFFKVYLGLILEVEMICWELLADRQLIQDSCWGFGNPKPCIGHYARSPGSQGPEFLENLFGGFQNWGYLIGGPHNKDCNILWSVLGSPYFGKLPFGY